MSVQNPSLTLVDETVVITWTPPVVPNGIIYQYIVKRVNSNRELYNHISANQNTIKLSDYSDDKVSIAAVNIYGQSDFEPVVSQGKNVCLTRL